jgi:hypothetical protein
MIYVHARTIPAQVVNHQAGSNFVVLPQISDTVGTTHLSGVAELPVTFPIFSRSPDMAARFFIDFDFGHEPLFSSLSHFDLLGRLCDPPGATYMAPG